MNCKLAMIIYSKPFGRWWRYGCSWKAQVVQHISTSVCVSLPYPCPSIPLILFPSPIQLVSSARSFSAKDCNWSPHVPSTYPTTSAVTVTVVARPESIIIFIWCPVEASSTPPVHSTDRSSPCPLGLIEDIFYVSPLISLQRYKDDSCD